MGWGMLATAVVAYCDTVNLVDSVNASFSNSRSSSSNKVSISNGVAATVFRAIDLWAATHGMAPKSLGQAKIVEIVYRVCIDLPIKMHEEEDLMPPGETPFLVSAKFVNNTLLRSAILVARAVEELLVCNERLYLQNYKENGSQAMRPVVDSDGDPQITYKPVNPKECRTTIQENQTRANLFAVARLGVEENRLTKAQTKGALLYNKLMQKLGLEALAFTIPSQTETESPNRSTQHLDSSHRCPAINLLACTTIPEPLERDFVFRKYLCAITRAPIRDPVGDPLSDTTLYERADIERWVERHHSSPVTRQPLSKHQLVPKPAVKALIENRLSYHQTHLVDYMRSSSILPTYLQILSGDTGQIPQTQEEQRGSPV